MKMTTTCGIQKFRWRKKIKTLVKILGGSRPLQPLRRWRLWCTWNCKVWNRVRSHSSDDNLVREYCNMVYAHAGQMYAGYTLPVKTTGLVSWINCNVCNVHALSGSARLSREPCIAQPNVTGLLQRCIHNLVKHSVAWGVGIKQLSCTQPLIHVHFPFTEVPCPIIFKFLIFDDQIANVIILN